MEHIAYIVTFLAGAMVALVALYLLGFGVLAFAVPARASAYLLGFAGSLRLHMLELTARFLVGAAFVGYASYMPFGGVFSIVGLVLIVTTLGLAFLPWRCHQRFAETTVPVVVPWLRVLGVASIAAGAFVCWAVARAVVV